VYTPQVELKYYIVALNLYKLIQARLPGNCPKVLV
jgi:hypothetical protein